MTASSKFRPCLCHQPRCEHEPTHPEHARHDVKTGMGWLRASPPPWHGLDPTRSRVAVMPTCHPSTPSSAAAAGEA